MNQADYQACVLELISPIKDMKATKVDVVAIIKLLQAGAHFDITKRELFYAKKPSPDRIVENLRTIDGLESTSLINGLQFANFDQVHIDPDLLHAAIGLATEVAEIWEEILKAMIEKRPVNLDNLQEELGDLDFYKTLGAASAERLDDDRGRFTEEGIRDANMAKLHTRYPHKRESVAAISGGERDKNAENQAMAVATPRHGEQP